MRVLIVDDEPLARSALQQALETREDVDELEVAKDAIEAREKIEEAGYDVLLLDIQMPELSGMDLAEWLNKRPGAPAIIFVTAHHQHAIAAFEQHAVDYVLKPFSPERIHEALDLAIHRTEGERAAKLVKILPQLETLLSRVPPKIAIKSKGRIVFIDPTNVVVVEAQGNYVLLQRQAGSYLLRESIGEVAEKLKSYGFVRIHRSMLVNSSFVEEVQPWPTGEYILRVRGGKELTVSRKYKKNLNALAQHWVGVQAFSTE